MSKIERTKCDFCGVEVLDVHAETDWIGLTNGALSVKMGRTDDNKAKSFTLRAAARVLVLQASRPDRGLGLGQSRTQDSLARYASRRSDRHL